jgi:hypothetical protein
MVTRLGGEVVLSNTVKGIAFVRAEKDLFFVNWKEIEKRPETDLRFLLEGEQVLFKPIVFKDRQQAVDVKIVRPRETIILNPKAKLLLDDKFMAGVADLRVDSLPEMFVYPLDKSGHKGIPFLATDNFIAWWVGEQHLHQFRVKMPAKTEKVGYCLLDHEKKIRTQQDGLVENVALGSYLVEARQTANGFKVEILCVGRRIQDSGSWLIVERRFHHEYPLQAKTLEDILENTPEPPIPDLKRNNAGFALGILRAIKLINA